MKLKIFTFIFVLILLAFQTACGQPQTTTKSVSTNSNIEQSSQVNTDKRVENLKKQAGEFLRASFDGDLEKLSKFIYFPKDIAANDRPDRIKKFKEANATKLIQEANSLKSQGFEFEPTIENPQEMVNAKNQLFSLVPISTITKNKGNRCDGKDFLLGISQDDGENWAFFKGNDSFQNQFELLFSEAAKKITLPAKPKANCYQE